MGGDAKKGGTEGGKARCVAFKVQLWPGQQPPRAPPYKLSLHSSKAGGGGSRKNNLVEEKLVPCSAPVKALNPGLKIGYEGTNSQVREGIGMLTGPGAPQFWSRRGGGQSSWSSFADWGRERSVLQPVQGEKALAHQL